MTPPPPFPPPLGLRLDGNHVVGPIGVRHERTSRWTGRRGRLSQTTSIPWFCGTGSRKEGGRKSPIRSNRKTDEREGVVGRNQRQYEGGKPTTTETDVDGTHRGGGGTTIRTKRIHAKGGTWWKFKSTAMGKMREEQRRRSFENRGRTLPLDVDGVDGLIANIAEAVQTGNANALQHNLPATNVLATLQLAAKLFKPLPPVIEVDTKPSVREVVVVGDTHGQFPDLLHLLRLAGKPSEERMIVFNGDYVDRGSWGVETFVTVLLMKLSRPQSVIMLRGNHESSTCTKLYGFFKEVLDKYGTEEGTKLYKMFKKVFAVLPLATVINKVTLVLHGGLFRAGHACEPEKKLGNEFWSQEQLYSVGSLTQLRNSSRGGTDPNGMGSATVASDVLWSDPTSLLGMFENEDRGIGMLYGPDVTEKFMMAEGIELIIRSHESPDARAKRPTLPDLSGGFSIDHDVQAGQLVTVFSAPDYPQFVEDEALRVRNKGAFLILRSPNWATPEAVQFEALQPRPMAKRYYASDAPDSDIDFPVPHISGRVSATHDQPFNTNESEFPATPSDAHLDPSPCLFCSPAHIDHRRQYEPTHSIQSVSKKISYESIEGFET